MNVICLQGALTPATALNAGLWDAFNTLPIGLCILDRNLCFIRINLKLSALTGIPSKACVGISAAKLMPKLIDKLRDNLRRAEVGQAVESVQICGETLSPLTTDRLFTISFHTMPSVGGHSDGLLC